VVQTGRVARKKFWNSWVLAHPLPAMVRYRDGDEHAQVEYGGLTREVPAVFHPERRHAASLPDHLFVSGFAARFRSGRRVWDGSVDFERNRGAAWSFGQVYVFDAPPSLEPARLLGFLSDFPSRERGVAGLGMMAALRDRARAGTPDGPSDAAAVGNWWPDRPPPN
jgi:hypothetical protein